VATGGLLIITGVRARSLHRETFNAISNGFIPTFFCKIRFAGVHKLN